MDKINLDKYDVEIIQQEDNSHDEYVKYLLNIINDRSIPKEQKQLVRKQFDEIIKMKINTMKPIIIKLTPKK